MATSRQTQNQLQAFVLCLPTKAPEGPSDPSNQPVLHVGAGSVGLLFKCALHKEVKGIAVR